MVMVKNLKMLHPINFGKIGREQVFDYYLLYFSSMIF